MFKFAKVKTAPNVVIDEFFRVNGNWEFMTNTVDVAFPKGSSFWCGDDGADDSSELPMPNRIFVLYSPDNSELWMVYLPLYDGEIADSEDWGISRFPFTGDLAGADEIVSRLTPEIIYDEPSLLAAGWSEPW